MSDKATTHLTLTTNPLSNLYEKDDAGPSDLPFVELVGTGKKKRFSFW